MGEDDDNGDDNGLDREASGLRAHFLGWQCRLRQFAVRRNAGRPSPGMCPDVMFGDDGAALSAVTVLIVPGRPEETTAQFRHLGRRTQDPKERLEAALKLLAATYFQNPQAFSDRLTAVFPPDLGAIHRLLAAERCVLLFSEKNQSYRLPCTVAALAEPDPAWQATYWHNRLFNPALASGVDVLAFTPDWAGARAVPPVG